MKKESILLLLAIFAFTSCKKDVNEPLAAPTVQEEMVSNESQIICYQGIIKKDTISLSLNFDQNKTIQGDLSYLLFEKDNSKGTIVGEMTGDTLKAIYTFMSEGKKSDREIVFLRKGKIMIEAYGDVEEREGKTFFKEPRKLFFDSATILTEIDCPEAK